MSGWARHFMNIKLRFHRALPTENLLYVNRMILKIL